MFSRRLELGSGLAAGVLGLLIVAFVLFGPVYQEPRKTPSFSYGDRSGLAAPLDTIQL